MITKRVTVILVMLGLSLTHTLWYLRNYLDQPGIWILIATIYIFSALLTTFLLWLITPKNKQ